MEPPERLNPEALFWRFIWVSSIWMPY
jgi:hypothetical protein